MATKYEIHKEGTKEMFRGKYFQFSFDLTLRVDSEYFLA